MEKNKIYMTYDDFINYRKDLEILGTNKNTVFHYTSLQGFLLMFADFHKNVINLFPSNMRYLNDKTEYQEGYSYVNNRCGNDDFSSPTLSEGYVCCFSSHGDLLSQWQMYGKNSGVAIEFNLENAKYVWWEDSNHDSKSIAQSVLNVPVAYDDNARDKYFKAINSEFTKKSLALLIPYIKNKSFSNEKESRLVFFPLEGKIFDHNIKTIVNYRERNGVIIPYLKVKVYSFDENDNGEYKDCTGLIKSIKIGPGVNQDLVFYSVINLLEKGNSNIEEVKNLIIKDEYITNESKIKVTKSKIPYR